MEERLIFNQQGIEKIDNRINDIRTESGNIYRGSDFIDAIYEGGLMPNGRSII